MRTLDIHPYTLEEQASLTQIKHKWNAIMELFVVMNTHDTMSSYSIDIEDGMSDMPGEISSTQDYASDMLKEYGDMILSFLEKHV